MNRRPTVAPGSVVTTPLAATMIRLLGPGQRSGPVTFSPSETEALNKLYGFKKEKVPEKRAKPTLKVKPNALPYEQRDAEEAHKKAVASWEREDPREVQRLMQAGADRNMARYAEEDGLRLVAWLAKHVQPGEDPLKTLIQLAVDAGWDVDPEDTSWAEAEPEEEAEAV